MSTFTFRPAARENVGLLIALAGASGSGKTFSALRLAQGLAGGGKIAFIDTEARRGLHYADRFDFMHADMRPPFRPERFAEGIRAAEEAGASVVILDSFSHEYDGEGGILDWAAELEAGTPKPGIDRPRDPFDRSGDGWKDWLTKPVKPPGNWKEPKLGHKRLMNALLQVRAHIIFCLRADEKIAIEKQRDERGRERTVVTPLGWMPICEKRFMFEMTASFTLIPSAPGIPQFDLPHKLQDQHRTMFPSGQSIGEQAGAALAAWARGAAGAPPAERDHSADAGEMAEGNPIDALPSRARAAARAFLRELGEVKTGQELMHLIDRARKTRDWLRENAPEASAEVEARFWAAYQQHMDQRRDEPAGEAEGAAA